MTLEEINDASIKSNPNRNDILIGIFASLAAVAMVALGDGIVFDLIFSVLAVVGAASAAALYELGEGRKSIALCEEALKGWRRTEDLLAESNRQLTEANKRLEAYERSYGSHPL